MILTLVLFLLNWLNRVRVKFSDTKQYLAMSEQQRERETVSRDKESIGRAQAAVGCVAALCCVCVGLPRV